MRRAHAIITDQGHVARTSKAGASPDLDELDGPHLRWPGYLGSAYGDSLRVVGVANVHRGFRSNHFDARSRHHTPHHHEAVSSAVRATDRLRQLNHDQLGENEICDYLDGVRPMYEMGMSQSWGVARSFSPAWLATGLERTCAGMRRMAYVNTSCCQVPEDTKLPKALKIKRDLKELCTTRHPLSGGRSVTDAIAILDPQVIVCSAKDAWDHLVERGVPDRVLTIPFHQHRGDHWLLAEVSFGPLVLPAHTHMRVWAEAVRDYLRSTYATG